MVGVPGKSKGCLTCRKRKIRCDLTKPDCNKCTSTGRTCQGYDTYPTFLINTQQGRQRRQHLEEAKPRTETESSSSSSTWQKASNDESSSSSSELVPLLRQPRVTDIEDYQLISCFWTKYVPAETTAQDPSPAPWLENALLTNNAGPALRLSLKALALTRLGWIDGNDALTIRGRYQYGLALKHIQRALYDPREMEQDDTLASAHCLAIYELYESTTFKAWNNHVTGLGHLIKFRGPDSYDSDLARATLYGFAFATMIHCIQFRKSTFMSSDEWRTRPWKRVQKDLHFRVLEFGFDGGAIIEQMDTARTLGSLNLNTTLEIILKLLELDRRMLRWYQEFSTEYAGVKLQPEYPQPFILKPVRVATTMLVYWALRLVLAYVVYTACSSLTAVSPQIRDAPNMLNNESIGAILKRYGTSHCLELSTNILRSMPNMLRDDMGLLAAQQTLFPLRIALFYLTRHGGEELRWCKDLYGQLNAKKGLRYAEAVSQTDGGYRGDLMSSEAERASWRQQQSLPIMQGRGEEAGRFH